jgi:hypothetical protein
MKPDEQIDLTALSAELVETFARELKTERDAAEAGAPARWTDGFRASGAKHM